MFIHAFTDGRDTDPKGGIGYIKDLQKHLDGSAGKIASVIGRYYSMDRDNRWERVKLAYDLLVHGTGTKTKDVQKSILDSYAEGVTDEFIKPLIVVNDKDQPLATIEEGDVVLCFNFRTDRGREITIALTQKDFPEQNMKKLDLYYVTLTNYDDSFKGVKVIFDKDNLNQTLGEVLAAAGKKADQDCRNREVSSRYFLLFRWKRKRIYRREQNLMSVSKSSDLRFTTRNERF